jgi:hypothetical protein
MSEPDLHWYHLAICQGMNDKNSDKNDEPHKDYFYEEYESDPVVAKNMDSICLSCPVRASCLREGVENKEFGLWGGVFLERGVPDEAKNAHKTQDVWDQIRGGITA